MMQLEHMVINVKFASFTFGLCLLFHMWTGVKAAFAQKQHAVMLYLWVTCLTGSLLLVTFISVLMAAKDYWR